MDLTDCQGIIFDKDGTLFEFRATWETWAQAFLLRLTEGERQKAAVVGEKIGFDFLNRKFSPDSVVIAGTPAQIAAALKPDFSTRSQGELLNILNEEAARAPQVQTVPLTDYLSDLKARGLKLGVATNDAEQPARQHLQSVGIEQYFDFIAGFDSGYGAKPGAGQLLAFCQQNGCRPERVLMVGDSTHDLKAGRRAGMKTVGVLTGLAPREVLEPIADGVLPDIGHIPKWLSQQSAP